MIFETVLNSFGLVALSEMGDKTQLLAFSLATRFKKPWTILFGIFVATLLNHSLAAYAGNMLSEQLNQKWMSLFLAITFFAFGIWALKPDSYETDQNPTQYGAFLSTVVLFFLAEIGDKTQLATFALGAKYQNSFQVTLGTTLGMLFSDGLAVFLGEKLSEKFQTNWIRQAAAILFFIYGGLSLFHFWQLLAK